MEIPSVRVLVVGDSGVGKTTLLRAVCRDPSAPRDAASAVQHRWTTGCDVHVLLHRYREGYGAEKEVYIEFIDVGGHPKYEISRAMFYHDVQGVIFMHDLSNARSYDHLKAWNSELALFQRTKGCVLPSPSARPGEYPSLNALPKLVIGNKRDTVKAHAKRTPALPELRNVDSIESVRTAPIISSSVLFLHSHSGALLHPRSHQSAEPYALEPTAFHGFLDRVVAFANTSSSGFGDSHAGEHTSGFLSPFSEGLRQMKSKPVGNSPLAASGPPLSSGSGGSARSWWK